METIKEFPKELEAKAVVVDGLMDELSDLVTNNGPYYLIRGMSNLEAYTAINACIKGLISDRNRVIHNIKEMTIPEVADKILQMELPHAWNRRWINPKHL